MASGIRIRFADKNVGRRYSASLRALGAKNKKALEAALRDARDEILDRGRANIRSAGRFGTRWTEGLRGRIAEGPNIIRLQVDHDVPYFPVFQEGRTIRGRPLLWIPLRFSDAVGTRARDYPAPLFRVDRAGSKAPLLLSTVDRQPKYFGKRQVTIPKKFRIVEICREVSRKIKGFFLNHVKAGRR